MARSDVIRTARLELFPFAESFLTKRYVDWLNDPEVVQYSEQRHHRHTFDTCRAYAQSFEGTPHYFWAITIRDSGQHIGNINAFVDMPNQVADIGIMVGERQNYGCGFGLEAWQAVCDYLLKEVGMRKVTGGTMASNLAMVRIMKKVGMEDDGLKRRQFLLEGKEVDAVYFALFK